MLAIQELDFLSQKFVIVFLNADDVELQKELKVIWYFAWS